MVTTNNNSSIIETVFSIIFWADIIGGILTMFGTFVYCLLNDLPL